MTRRAALGFAALLAAAGAGAQQSTDAQPRSATPLDQVQVTATREPEPVDQVPASISVVTGEELRERGARDLRGALAWLAGVEGTPGGDAGPAGTVPALWGLREADAFLLVVDGVPWGGAFNPATASLELTGVERIEILRGAAPVMYGATSFVGVIHVIHQAAGQAAGTLEAGAGSYGSYGLSGSANLAPLGGYLQSLSFDAERAQSADDRSGFDRLHLLYRGARSVGAARLHVDADVSLLNQQPAGNLLLRDGTTVHWELPVYANYNPAGARVDERRYQLKAGLDGSARLGEWSLTLALTRTLGDALRGFLRGEAFALPPDALVGDGAQADGYSQRRAITDVYADAHVTTNAGARLNLSYGLDYLHGYGAQHAVNFGYCVDRYGHEQACSGARHADEIVRSDDRRDFFGLYAQADWKLARSVDVLAGLRLNHTREAASGSAIDNTGALPQPGFDGSDARNATRLSGVAGLSWAAWRAGSNALTWYADYRDSFKPLAVDFGPEAEVTVLRPETAQSIEAGAKLQLLEGRLDIDSSAFRMDFRNGLDHADDGAGHFVRVNGGRTRFQGLELESRLQLTRQLLLAAHYALHDARFVAYTSDSGADVAGKRVEMSPRQLGGLGLIYAPARGLGATLSAEYVGARALNKSNSVRAGGYTTLDATLSRRFRSWRLQLGAYNLGDRRDPVAESELSEAVTVTQTAGYYRLSARSFRLSASSGF